MLLLVGAILVVVGAFASAIVALNRFRENSKERRALGQIGQLLYEVEKAGDLDEEASESLSALLSYLNDRGRGEFSYEFRHREDLYQLVEATRLSDLTRSRLQILLKLASPSLAGRSLNNSPPLVNLFIPAVLFFSGLGLMLAEATGVVDSFQTAWPGRPPPTDNVGAPVDREYAVQRVFFGTDRAVEASDEGELVFGFKRADELTVGIADVTIPSLVHRVGQVELPRSFTVFTVTLWQEDEDPKRHFTIRQIVELGQTELQAMAAEVMSETQSYPSTAFVFVHGFNTGFSDAVYRTAQLAWDLRFDGPAFLYSWPSVGDTEDYVTDIDAAAETAPYMDEFFELVLSTPGVERVHIIAHSMGNAALAELFQKAGTRLSEREGPAFDEIILASPDINVRGFRQVSEHFKRFAEDVTLYASSTDRALLASKKIRSDFVRLGDVGTDGPAVVPGVYSIDVSSEGTDIFALNHNIYVTSKLILSDLGQLFRFGTHPPNLRSPTFLARDGDDGRFWYVPY